MFSSPPTTGMFRFVGFASPQRGCHACAWRVAPFGHPRINGRSRLPADFRGLPRPSSPPGAKASSVRPVSLLALACRSAHRCASLARVSSCLCVCFHFPSCQRTAQVLPASVENVGLEPTTPGLQSRCSSQLSQSPRCQRVVPGRLELPTPTLSVWCSNRLSYGTPSPAPRGRALTVSRVSPLVSLSGQHRNLSGTVAPRRPSRKEVFQPHLPVRLPCYDLAPVTTFALDGSPPASGARGSHGLTGGVYKARERIHRAMADARLLAIPASRGRVAAPDPY